MLTAIALIGFFGLLLFGTAVTFGTPPPTRHVFGDCVARFFVVNGATGTTLATGMSQILFVANQPFCQAGTASLITGITVSGGTITFTSSAPMVNEVIEVIARVG